MEECGLATALSFSGGLQKTTHEEIEGLPEGLVGASMKQVGSQEESHRPTFKTSPNSRALTLAKVFL